MLLLFLESLVLQQFLNDAGNLTAIYWRIRYTRSVNKRRKWYRMAAKEKGHLVALGYAPEAVRLYALYMRNPSLERRYKRFLEEFQKPPEPIIQLTLF